MNNKIVKFLKSNDEIIKLLKINSDGDDLLIMLKDSKSESYFFTLHAIHDKNVVLTYNSYTSEKVELILIERTIGIPSDWLLSPFPDDMIYGTGIYSNTVITKKTYNLEVSK